MITEERLAETLRCLQDMQKDDRIRFYYPFLDGVQEVIRTLRAENEGLKNREGNLAMMVRRLANHKHMAGSKTSESAYNLLKRYGLQGSLLRGEKP